MPKYLNIHFKQGIKDKGQAHPRVSICTPQRELVFKKSIRISDMYARMYVCLHVCGHECMCVYMCMWRQRLMSGIFLTSFLIFIH